MISKKTIISAVLFLLLSATLLCLGTTTGFMNEDCKVYAASSEVRGLWVSTEDLTYLKLENASEKNYTSTIRKLMKKAAYYGVNNVYFCARDYDEALYKSKVFPASNVLTTDYYQEKAACYVYKYDPLKIAINEAHKQDLKIHAWINPCRVYDEGFLDPAKDYTKKRIIKAIKEVHKYDIDGIMLEGSFYDSLYDYMTPENDMMRAYSVKISSAEKRKNVNELVKALYKKSKSISSRKFGISVCGNINECMYTGADVKTWMSKNGYLNYIVPKVYWTDSYGASGDTKKFTSSVKKFKTANKKRKPMYTGLALYKTGTAQSDDPGWGNSRKNIATQIAAARNLGIKGYVLYSAQDLYDSNSMLERFYMKRLVKPIFSSSITLKNKNVTLRTGETKTITVKFNPVNTMIKALKYTSSDPDVAKVSKNGVIKAITKGNVYITVTTKNGKIAKCRVYVR